MRKGNTAIFSLASFEEYVMVYPFPFNVPSKLDDASGTSEILISLHNITFFLL